MIGSFIGAPIGGVNNYQTGNTGVAAVTLGDLSQTATGTLAISGQTSTTLGDVTLTATGTIALTGSASITLDDVTLSATGALAISGVGSTVLDDLTLSATMAHDPHAVGGVVLDDIVFVASAHVGARILARIGSGGYADSPDVLGGATAIIAARSAMSPPRSRGGSITRLTAGGGRI